MSQPARPDADEAITIPLVQEQLHVGVRQRDTGRGVRVRTSVSERIEQVDQLLRQEDVAVERVAVDRVVAADQAPVTRYEGDTLVVPVLEEVLVIERRVRIKEELRISKTTRQQRHVENVALKSEQALVERFDDADAGAGAAALTEEAARSHIDELVNIAKTAKTAAPQPSTDCHDIWRLTMQHTLIAVFDNHADAQLAKDELRAAGFSSAEIRQDGAAGGGTGTGTGAQAGASGDPGSHSFGAGIRHFFSELFGTEDSKYSAPYSAAVARGQHVLTVAATEEREIERAADIVERYGPVDIDEESDGQFLKGGAGVTASMPMQQAGSQQSAGMSAQSATDNPQGNVQGGQAGSQQRAAEGTVLPVIEESLKVGKRAVQRGGLRIFQRLRETPVSETVSLREEHVSVERRPVDQPAAANLADLSNFQEKSIEVRETAEEAVVEKTARVVEEVVVAKQVSEHDQKIAETLLRTEVEVEQLPPSATSSSDSDNYFRQHYASNYSGSGRSYDDYLPAYSYGLGMAGQDSYRGRAWNDVEPSLRSDWEKRNPGSLWDDFKAAVRHGWEKITG
ncbi:MAG: hypothetical protein JWP59_940 [Massilia sp.]|nr:hypothetical protein [Massilia sp.]